MIQVLKDVSIIILNYNQAQLTLECVTSLYEQETTLDFKVIVVDNCSKQEEVEL